MQSKWYIFEVWRDIKNIAFAVTAVPGVIDFHFWSWKSLKSVLEKRGHPGSKTLQEKGRKVLYKEHSSRES